MTGAPNYAKVNEVLGRWFYVPDHKNRVLTVMEGNIDFTEK